MLNTTLKYWNWLRVKLNQKLCYHSFMKKYKTFKVTQMSLLNYRISGISLLKLLNNQLRNLIFLNMRINNMKKWPKDYWKNGLTVTKKSKNIWVCFQIDSLKEMINRSRSSSTLQFHMQLSKVLKVKETHLMFLITNILTKSLNSL